MESTASHIHVDTDHALAAATVMLGAAALLLLADAVVRDLVD